MDCQMEERTNSSNDKVDDDIDDMDPKNSSSSIDVVVVGATEVTTTLNELSEDYPEDDDLDPMLMRHCPSDYVQEGDWVILEFGDGRLLFAQANLPSSNKNKVDQYVKLNRRSYCTAPLVGLPYGSVLEQGQKQLIPLPIGSKLVPEIPPDLLQQIHEPPPPPTSITPPVGTRTTTPPTTTTGDDDDENKDLDSSENINNNDDNCDNPSTVTTTTTKLDNRYMIDNNTAQTLDPGTLREWKLSGTAGATIVNAMVQNSLTFDTKTTFSKVKYVHKKQKKYQPRCRIIHPTSDKICQFYHMKDPKKICNLRPDTLAQILSYANITAGNQILIFETTGTATNGTESASAGGSSSCQGLITGSVASRLGGYGVIVSIYTGQQPSVLDTLNKFNFTWSEAYSIHWLHGSYIFSPPSSPSPDLSLSPSTRLPLSAPTLSTTTGETTLPPPTPQQQQQNVLDESNVNTLHQSTYPIDVDIDLMEIRDRTILQWPCPLQEHTRTYLRTDPNMINHPQKVTTFLQRRSNRFLRKCLRPTSYEIYQTFIQKRYCDSLIMVVNQYDPIITFMQLFTYLAPSCPFVLYSEFIEPLTECFRYLQGEQQQQQQQQQQPKDKEQPNCQTDDDDDDDDDNDNNDDTEDIPTDGTHQNNNDDVAAPPASSKDDTSSRSCRTYPLAINLRLMDTWTREYQILPGRTHPMMNMSQSGGYLLTGIKLDPITGHNELTSEELQQIREQIGTRRQRNGHQPKNKNNNTKTNNNNKKKSNSSQRNKKMKITSTTTNE